MASKLTDTELTVGADGHKITGVAADGNALTDGVTLPQVTSTPSTGRGDFTSTYPLTFSVSSLKEAVAKLQKYAHRHSNSGCAADCGCQYNCDCDNDKDGR